MSNVWLALGRAPGKIAPEKFRFIWGVFQLSEEELHDVKWCLLYFLCKK